MTAVSTPSIGRYLSNLLPGITATKLGLHYVRYHARLPIISGLTGDEEAVAATSEAAVAERAAELAPVYESTGLSPEEALAQARAARRPACTVSIVFLLEMITNTHADRPE